MQPPHHPRHLNDCLWTQGSDSAIPEGEPSERHHLERRRGPVVTVNEDLLHRTMNEILAHPEQHFQGAWAIRRDCGTAYCFAGTACVLSGLKVDWREWEDATHLTTGERIEEAATRLLGLDRYSAASLFSAFDSTADLKHYVDEICEHGMIRDAQPAVSS